MVKLVDERAPLTVRMAALLMCVSAILEFMLQLSGILTIVRESFLALWWPWPQVTDIVVNLLIAWLVARLNGGAYWIAQFTTALGIGAFLLTRVVPALRSTAQPLLSAWGLSAWFEWLLLVAIFILLVARPSRQAPWGLMKGFSAS